MDWKRRTWTHALLSTMASLPDPPSWLIILSKTSSPSLPSKKLTLFYLLALELFSAQYVLSVIIVDYASDGRIKLFGMDNTQALLQSNSPVPTKFLQVLYLHPFFQLEIVISYTILFWDKILFCWTVRIVIWTLWSSRIISHTKLGHTDRALWSIK